MGTVGVNVPDTVLELLEQTGDDYRELKVYVYQGRQFRRWRRPVPAILLGIGTTVTPIRVGRFTHRIHVPIFRRGLADTCLLAVGGVPIGDRPLFPTRVVRPGDFCTIRLELIWEP